MLTKSANKIRYRINYPLRFDLASLAEAEAEAARWDPEIFATAIIPVAIGEGVFVSLAEIKDPAAHVPTGAELKYRLEITEAPCPREKNKGGARSTKPITR